VSMKNYRGLIVGAAAVLLFAGNAHAVDRSGFNFGFGVGFGSRSLSDCPDSNDFCSKSGLAGNGYAGFMLGERLALVLDVESMTYKVDTAVSRETEYFTTGMVGLKYWATEKAWIRGGAGLGLFSNDLEEESKSGLALGAAAGYELMQGDSLIIDIQARFTTTKFPEETFTDRVSRRCNGFSGQVGLNWY
jgi:hypothetical protein